MGDIVSHVEFTPDGKRALVTKFNAHKVSLLDINGDKVTYTKLDLPTYFAGVNPELEAKLGPNGKVKSVELKYPRSAPHQYLRYGAMFDEGLKNRF